MNREEIEAALKVCDAATEGPWGLVEGNYTVALKVGTEYVSVPYQKPYGRGACQQQIADGRFMSHARTGYPAALRQLLLAEEVVSAARAEVCTCRK